MFRPGALVLDPSAFPRRLGACHSPADLYRQGLTSPPGHLVSCGGRREGVLTLPRASSNVSSLQPRPSPQGAHFLPQKSLLPEKSSAPQTLSAAHPPGSSSCWEAQAELFLASSQPACGRKTGPPGSQHL